MDGDVMGGGSFRGVRQWLKKLLSSLSTVEGIAHKNSCDRRNYTRRLDYQTHPSTIEEASVLCVGDGGSSRESVNGG